MDKLKQTVFALIGLRLTKQQVQALEIYERELITWNSKFNLTAIRDAENIRSKHFLDSFSTLLVLRENLPARLIDVGTGAGFPGIPLKIICPSMRLSLVESVGKKAEFCQHIVNLLELEKVTILTQRAEEVGRLEDHREKYDWAVARAVANLPTLVEYLLPLVKVGGAVLAQKGDSGPFEAHQAENAIKILGGHLRQIRKLDLPGIAEDRYLIVIDKKAATPPQYPRRVGAPSKRPI